MSDNIASQLSTLEISPPSEPLSEFHLFPTLPMELRLKIFVAALSQPRNLTITCSRRPFKRGEPRRTAEAFKCNVPPPSLLHVCRESRHEALEIYKPHFQASKSNDTCSCHSGRGHHNNIPARGSIYVSFSQDTLRFEDTILVYVAETELQGIQSLILDVKDPGYFGHFNMDIVKRMKGLKELEMWGQRREEMGWSSGDGWFNYLIREFEVAKRADPGWDCPNLRILARETGKQVATIAGGALVPGWVDERPHEDEDTDVGFRI